MYARSGIWAQLLDPLHENHDFHFCTTFLAPKEVTKIQGMRKKQKEQKEKEKK